LVFLAVFYVGTVDAELAEARRGGGGGERDPRPFLAAAAV